MLYLPILQVLVTRNWMSVWKMTPILLYAGSDGKQNVPERCRDASTKGALSRRETSLNNSDNFFFFSRLIFNLLVIESYYHFFVCFDHLMKESCCNLPSKLHFHVFVRRVLLKNNNNIVFLRFLAHFKPARSCLPTETTHMGVSAADSQRIIWKSFLDIYLNTGISLWDTISNIQTFWNYRSTNLIDAFNRLPNFTVFKLILQFKNCILRNQLQKGRSYQTG